MAQHHRAMSPNWVGNRNAYAALSTFFRQCFKSKTPCRLTLCDGPPGTGKTFLTRAWCRLNQQRLHYYDCGSDDRGDAKDTHGLHTAEHMKQIVEQIVGPPPDGIAHYFQQQQQQQQDTVPKFNVMIIDNLEAPLSSTSTWSNVARLVELCRTTWIPIVFITNDTQCARCRQLLTKIKMRRRIHFKAVPTARLYAYLLQRYLKESLNVNLRSTQQREAIREIAVAADGDVRRAMIDLDFWSVTMDKLPSLHYHNNQNVFNHTRTLLNNDDDDTEKYVLEQIQPGDLDFTTHLVQLNYTQACGSDDGALKRAANTISHMDTLRTDSIQDDFQYHLREHRNLLTLLGVSTHVDAQCPSRLIFKQPKPKSDGEFSLNREDASFSRNIKSRPCKRKRQ